MKYRQVSIDLSVFLVYSNMNFLFFIDKYIVM